MGGTGSTTSGFDFEYLTLDSTQKIYITISLQKDAPAELLQLQIARLYSTFIP